MFQIDAPAIVHKVQTVFRRPHALTEHGLVSHMGWWGQL